MDDESIAASHDALFTSTGSVVIGVFHTLSAGKTGQFVPGRVVPATFANALGADEIRPGDAPAPDAMVNADEIATTHTRDCRDNRCMLARLFCIGIPRFLRSLRPQSVHVRSSLMTGLSAQRAERFLR